MSEREIKEFEKVLEEYIKELPKNREASQKFLVNAGIYTQDGKPTENYEHLCIPLGQD